MPVSRALALSTLAALGACEGSITGGGDLQPDAGGIESSPDASFDDDSSDDSPAALVFGRVPKPEVIESHLDGANHPMVGYSTEPIVVEGVVWHRMLGYLYGSDSWFHGGNAATEYGIGVAAMDGADLSGEILEWIDPANGHWYGHSSGPVSEPYGDGKAFVDRFGIDRVNPQTVAIEIAGNYDTPLDPVSRDSLIALTAYFADQREIPWHEFPNVPGQDRSFVMWHQHFTIGTGKVCPGEVVMGETDALTAEIAEYLRGFQEGSE